MDKSRAICPVCGMLVSRRSRFTSIFRRRKYYFCCNDCKSAFVSSPFKYIIG